MRSKDGEELFSRMKAANISETMISCTISDEFGHVHSSASVPLTRYDPLPEPVIFSELGSDLSNLTLTSGDVLIHCTICGDFPPSTSLIWMIENGPDITDDRMAEDVEDCLVATLDSTDARIEGDVFATRLREPGTKSWSAGRSMTSRRSELIRISI